MKRNWIRRLATLSVGLVCALAFTTMNLGCACKNPIYYSHTPYFWNNCSGIAGKEDWYLWGIPSCGKGEPSQSMHVGHATSPARFEKITVGVRK